MANSFVDEALPMLTDLALKKLKLKDKSYKNGDTTLHLPSWPGSCGLPMGGKT
jgi:hypothetical protein